MMRMLCELYPDADCELTFKNEYELLTAVILSAQTTDVQVNKVTPKLFAAFPTPQALASGDIEKIKELVKATGYYNNKAKSIQACAAAVVEKFAGCVPKTLDELITLPGVGRKTANVVLGVIHKIPGWTVDTHVQRLSQRFGFTKNTDPHKIELDLQKLFPEEDWTKYSITIIWHGRRLCYARNPDCINCPLKSLCPSSLAP
jgi:endonuclease-3